MKTQYSGEIDFWKFIFAFVIVALHSSYLPASYEQPYFIGGSIGVEFFFIVSGFFLAKSSERVISYQNLAQESIAFMIRKIKPFFSYSLFAFIVALIAKTMFYGEGVIQFIKNGVNGIIEVLFLKATGIGNEFFNNPTWYLSAMLLTMLILYPLLLKYKKSFSQIVCPIIGLLILGYLYQKYGHLRDPDCWDGFFRKGTLRGFAEISLGIACYELCMQLRKYNFTVLSKAIFTIIEYGSLIAIIWYSNTETCWDMDCPSVILMGIAVIIAGGNLSLLSGFWSKLKITPFLGKFSLMIYLNHIYWVWIFDIIGLEMSYKEMFILYMLAAICSALACWGIVDLMKAVMSKHKKAIGSCFIAGPKI